MIDVPLWAEIPIALLLVAGGLLVAVGALGLLRLPDFLARMHAPAMVTTLGAGCVLVASLVMSSILLRRLVVHELVITLFIVLTAPVTATLLARAAVYRGTRRRDRD